MSELLRAFAAYETFNPTGWVTAHLFVPIWLALILVAVGALLLVAGGGSTFRLIAAPLGLVVGLMFTRPAMVGLGIDATPQLSAIAALALLVLGVALPQALLFFALGLPLGVGFGTLAGPADFMLGFLPGFLVGGAVGAMAYRVVGALLASALGAWMFILGLLAVLAPVGRISQQAIAHPWLVLALAGVVALLGALYQLILRPSPEEAEKLRREKIREAQRLAEKAELERRWGR